MSNRTWKQRRYKSQFHRKQDDNFSTPEATKILVQIDCWRKPYMCSARAHISQWLRYSVKSELLTDRRVIKDDLPSMPFIILARKENDTTLMQIDPANSKRRMVRLRSQINSMRNRTRARFYNQVSHHKSGEGRTYSGQLHRPPASLCRQPLLLFYTLTLHQI